MTDRLLTPAERSWLEDVARGERESGAVVVTGWSSDNDYNRDLLALLKEGFVTVETRYRLTDKGRAALRGHTS